MNSTQAATLSRALQRAQEREVVVTGKGQRKSDGAMVYAVPSSSQPGRWHLILVTGARLVCDCHAGKRGLMCQHRALVRERIAAERAERAERSAAATVAGAAIGEHLLIAAIASRDTHHAHPTHPGDTALIRRSNRPFSLLK